METKRNIIFTVLCSILIIIFCISICPVELQNDTFYTVKIGEYIMQNGIGVLHNGIDPFSWHDDLPYTFPHWGYDCIIYFFYSIAGFLGVHISTLIFACILGLSVFFINTKLSKNSLTSFILTLMLMYLMRAYVAARAQLVTFILFIWTIYFIEMYLKTAKKRYAIPLIIIPIIIANVHLAVWPFYFVLYLPYIAEYIISWLPDLYLNIGKFRVNRINKRIKTGKIYGKKKEKANETTAKLMEKNKIFSENIEKRKEHSYKLIVEKNNNVLGLIIIVLLCAFTGFLTPLGNTPYTYLINTLQGNTMKSISEHLPLTLIESKDFMCVLSVFLVILLFTDTKIKLRDFFMISGLLLMALSTRRQVSMFVLIGFVILNRIICSFVDKYDPNGCNNMKKFMLTIPGIIITIGVVLICSLYMLKPKINNQFINQNSYPVSACDYILENVDIKNMKIFNDYNYGSYLLYRNIPVFIDSRCDLYAPEYNGGQDIFSDYINIANIGVYYEDKFEEYEITHVLIYKKSKLNMLISKNKGKYNLLYSDDKFCFYKIEK